MFCSNCGSKAFEDGDFCPECGARLAGGIAPANQESVAPSQQIPSEGVTTSAAKIKKPPVKIIVLASVLGFFALAAAISASSATSQQFKNAVIACNSAGDDSMFGAQIAEDGKSLYLNGSGDEDFLGMSSSDEFCILDELGMPAMVKTRMLETNALMGVQEAEWQGITAKWTYHPDNGMDVSLEK